MKLNIVPVGNDKVFYAAKSVRKGRKVKTVNIIRIGKLSELSLKYPDPVTYCKNYVKKLTEEERQGSAELVIKLKQNEKIEIGKQSRFNAGYLFLQKIFSQLDLDNVCKSILETSNASYDLGRILRDLVFSRIIFPSSKLSTFDLSHRYLEQPNYDIQNIYRALDLLSANIDLIQSKAYEASSKVCKRDTKVLYYDCTNFFFEIEEQDGFRNYGVSKEHRPNPIVQMGLFMDGSGLPLAFNINPGNQSEQLSPLPTEKLIEKDFKLSKFIYCSDAGLGSYSIRWFNQLSDRSYIVTQSLKKLKNEQLIWALDDSGWNDKKTIKGLDSDSKEVLYKATALLESGKINVGGGKKEKRTIKNQRLIVTYSPVYARYQKQIRDNQVERAQKIIASPSKYDKFTSTDCKRFIENIRYDKNGEIIANKLSLLQSAIDEEAKYDGYYALITNLDGEVKEIVDINHNRWEIEESFRIMKTSFKSRPVYLQKENRIKAHFLTCFLALLIYRILEQKVNAKDEKYTADEIVSALRDADLLELNEICYVPTFKRTKLTDRLEEISGLNISSKGISNTNCTKLIRESKKRN